MLDQDVQSRVDAYRGNPQALQQKYSVSKDLLDLMALQKLTKEKESAARELQMAMAAQQGQGPGTIRDQLQQKALGMTKQELAQQQSKLLAQQQQQQQQNMQQLAQSGIAQNSAPNMEEGLGFASGGIIAFAGPTGSQVLRPFEDPYSDVNVARDKIRRGEPLTEREENLLKEKERLLLPPTSAASEVKRVAGRGFVPVSGSGMPSTSAPEVTRVAGRGFVPTEPSVQAQLNQMGSRIASPRSNINPDYSNEGRAYQRNVPAPGIPSALPQRQEAPSQAAQAAQAQPQPRPRPAARPAQTFANPDYSNEGRMHPAPIRTDTAERPPEAVGIATLAAPTAPAAAEPVKPAAEPAAAPAATGLTNIPITPQTDMGGLAPEDSTIARVAARKIAAALDGGEDPNAVNQGIRTQFKSEYGLTEDEKKDRKAYQDMLRNRYAGITNPEQLQRDSLKQFLLGMAGASNSGIALARGAAAAQNYEAGRNAEALKVLGDINDISEKEIAARRAGALKGFELGGEEGRSARTAKTNLQTNAMNSITNLMGFDAQDQRSAKELASREKIANAEISARKDIAGWDNQTKLQVVDATNKMHREVQEMAGQVQRDVANVNAASHKEVAKINQQGHLQSAGISAASHERVASLNRQARLEEVVMSGRMRLAAVEETALKSIDAAAAKEKATILVGPKGPTDEQNKRFEAIDTATAALKADLRVRMSDQITELGLPNVLGPNILKPGQDKGQGGGKYTVTKEPAK